MRDPDVFPAVEPSADDAASWLVGVAPNASNNRWHAVDRLCVADGGWPAGWSPCGALVRVAARYGAYRDAHLPGPVCAACVWWLAIRSESVAAEIARLPEQVRSLAERIIMRADDDGYEVPHPRTIQLLAAVTDHAPTRLVSGECTEGSHDHDGNHPCPVVAWGCDACSVTAEGWAGEWEGTYFPECVVDSPCSVLTTLAAHYSVRLGQLPKVEPAPECCNRGVGAGWC